MDFDAGRPGDHCRPAGAACLKACKQNRASAVGSEVFKVVQNTSTRGHAARRYNDRRHWRAIEVLRLLDVAGVPGNRACGAAGRFVESMLVRMRTKNIACIDGHGAVEVDWQVRYARRRFEPCEVVQDELSASDCERGYQYCATARRSPVDDVGEYRFGVRLIVLAPPVGRLYDEMIRARDSCRRRH